MRLLKPNAVLVFGVVVLSSAAFQLVTTARVGLQPDRSYILPNGQQITPAGTHIEVADRPLGMALSPDGQLLAVVTGSSFAPAQIHLVDVNARAIVQSIGIGDSFVGVAFSSDGGQLYVGGGTDNDVKVYRRQASGSFAAAGSIISITNSEPSGLSIDRSGATLYVALNIRHSVAIVDIQARTFKEVPVGVFPYTTAVTRDGAKVYVSNWGGRRVRPGDKTDGFQPVVVDPQTGIASTGTISVLDPTTRTVVNNIDVGLHPSGMALSPDGRRLYVVNANSDTVSVIRTLDDSVEKTIDVKLFAGAPLGSAPDALAVSPDGKRLYVANAANNAVAVVEPDNPGNPVRGFIPTGWFPTAVALSPSGNTLYVASGYGFGSVANQGKAGRSFQDRAGVISILAVPDDAALAVYTRQVLLNSYPPQAQSKAIPRRRPSSPRGSFDPSRIKHVFYIIKENRTYDQVLGDLAQGNGQPSLVQFGRNVTPNHHALAERFVLLDNFYAAGDQSALGHQWCDEAYANDYVHKYGNARNDFAGSNPMAYAPTGFLWDHVRNHGMTVRMYGEFAATNMTPGSSTWTDVYNSWKNATGSVSVQSSTRVAGVRDILAPRYAGFEMRVADQSRVPP